MAQPEKVIRIGSVSASVFVNESTEHRSFRSVTLQRSYRDGDQTKYTGNLNLGHLPNAIAVLKLALEHIAHEEAE